MVLTDDNNMSCYIYKLIKSEVNYLNSKKVWKEKNGLLGKSEIIRNELSFIQKNEFEKIWVCYIHK